MAQKINISDETYSAIAAKHGDVSAYLEQIAKDALAAQGDFDPRCGMSEEELRQSAAECVRINESMKAGNERDARKAFTQLGKEFGFDVSE